jgi:regulator of cell morphogenesis and NO signaling
MNRIDTAKPIGTLVAEHPDRARVFERFGLDYCCGGKQPLAAACKEAGLDAAEVARALVEADAHVAPGETDWSQASLAELVAHIVATHRAYLRRELPRLTGLAGKVVEVHGQRHPGLGECRDVFAGLCAELEPHMQKEEVILFPMIARMEAARWAEAVFCGSIRNPIRVMEMEHDSAGAALASLRRLTGDHTPPADACNNYRGLLSGLADLEADLHQHIHKENNILFPRAARLEEELRGGTPAH